tara:strand:- start:2151 stop:2717 length:567 start_codon:yes stop_codon:yes gene_type:complete
MIKDRNIGYKYKKDWFPAAGFNSYTGAFVPSLGGSPGLVQIGSLGVTGASMADEDDFLRMAFPLPSHWDLDNDIHFRVLWSDQATGSQAVTWKVLWRTFQFQQAPANPSEEIVLSDTNSGVGDSIDATPWGTLNGGTWSEDLGYLLIDVELHTDGTPLDPVFVGLEVAYIPKLTSGTQVSDQSPPSDA